MTFSLTQLRHRIVYAVVLTVVLLGVPLWYATTSIHRAALPEAEIERMSANLQRRVNYEVPVHLLGVPAPLNGLIDEAQGLVDAAVKEKIGESGLVVPHFVLSKANSSTAGYTVELITMEPEDDRQEAVYVSPLQDKTVKLFISADVIRNGKVADFIMRVVTETLFEGEIEMARALGRDHQGDFNMVKMPYSPKYKVAISFLEESDDPIVWDVEPITKVFENYLAILSEYANFTVETQVGYYESLLETANLVAQDDGTLLLRDTSTFLDYSEWGLDQDVEPVPTINLVVYVPNSGKQIRIEDSTSNSFLVPQWGGVVILNNAGAEPIGTSVLSPIFDIFASQLFRLVGAPAEPKSPFVRADILARWQSVENLFKSVDNLVSLIKLTEQLPTIPIPEITLKGVDETMRLVNESVSILDTQQEWWTQVNTLSSKALELSDRAFFQKDMVQQVYFPEEHKMAVYLPMMGPLTTIILLGVQRTLRERRARKA